MNKTDKNRRKLLKFLLAGAGALLLGKVFGPRFLSFFASSKKEEYLFENFRVTEDKKELTIYERSGEAIFIIDKR